MIREDNKSIVGAVCLDRQHAGEEIGFEEILLDKSLEQSDIWIRKEALQNVGGINYRLGAKKNYELLIRVAKEYKVCRIGQVPGSETDDWIHLEPETVGNEEECLKADCYLIGRYKAELLSMGCFDEAVLQILMTKKEDVTQYLERMLTETKEYYDIYDCTQPILIYTGSDVCYNILDTFAGSLGNALKERGQCVEYFDISKQQIEELGDYAKRRFKAVIGIQTYMFSVKWGNGAFVHDSISAPKYQFVFDHPIRMKDHLQQTPKRLCVLTPDGNYANFVENYYGHSARFLPPAGIETHCECGRRDYEITFLGSYYDGPIEDLRAIRSMDKERCYLINRYILYMRRDLRMIPEEALKKALEYYGITCTREEFMEIMYRDRWAIYCLSYHYRNKAVRILLESGIRLHVFGDTWKDSPWWGHPGLIWHEEVMGEDALKVYAKSKLSLNIMTWHKDGFTERIANAMLQKSVVVTDRTTYLEKNFVSGEDLLMFDLGNLQELPGQIKELFDNDEKRKQMAENGYRKALQQHTWRQRAEKILEYIEEDRETAE